MVRRFEFMPVQWANGRWAPSPRLPWSAPVPVPVRIASWNVWFGDHRWAQRSAALLATLRQRDLDVLALQEVTQGLLDALLGSRWIRSDYQVSELEVIGYDVILLSRLPMYRVATVPLPSTMGRGLIVAELTCGLEVATTHLESTRPMARSAPSARHPDEWVCLVEMDRVNPNNFEFRTARVIGHGKTRREPVEQAMAWRAEYEFIGHYFTGRVMVRPPRPSLIIDEEIRDIIRSGR